MLISRNPATRADIYHMTTVGRLGAELLVPRKAPDVRSVEPQNDRSVGSPAADDRQSHSWNIEIVAVDRWLPVGGADRGQPSSGRRRGAYQFHILHAARRGALRFDLAGAALVSRGTSAAAAHDPPSAGGPVESADPLRG